MMFSELEQVVEYLSNEVKINLRSKYIDKFIDTSSDYYKKHVKEVREYSDGICYSGYLWDCLLKPTIIKLEDVMAYKERLNIVLVFWDIHSSENIWIKDYWKFGKDTVIKLKYSDFLDNLEYFPEDVYIFDESLEWTIVLTHEYNNEVRICVKAGDLLKP